MTEINAKAINERTIWLRGIYMLIYAFILWIAKFVTGTVVVFQFLSVLFKGSTNPQLLALGQGLSIYTYQIMLYLTFNTEEHPYPLSAWPSKGIKEISDD